MATRGCVGADPGSGAQPFGVPLDAGIVGGALSVGLGAMCGAGGVSANAIPRRHTTTSNDRSMSPAYQVVGIERHDGRADGTSRA